MAMRLSNLCVNCARRLTHPTIQSNKPLNTSLGILRPFSLNTKSAFSTSCGVLCKNTVTSRAEEERKDTTEYHEKTERERNEEIAKSGAVDYSYFKNIIEVTKATPNTPRGVMPIDVNVLNKYMERDAESVKHETTDQELMIANEEYGEESAQSLTTGNQSQSLTLGNEKNMITKPKKIPGLKNIKPKLPTKSYTLTPYVNECQALQNLLSLGVDLTKVEKDTRLCNFLLKCDWEKDIQPYMVFLHKLGIPDSALGVVISRFPSIFINNPRHLEESIRYLQSKKFSEAEIAQLIERAPSMLNLTVKNLDANLGYLQKEFHLKGSEVRLVLLKYPKIAVYNKTLIQMTRHRMLEAYEFSKEQVKVILVSRPDVFMRNMYALEKTMQVLVDDMGLSRQFIAENSVILTTRDHIIKQRHRFLKQIDRAQYDPEKPKFVSMKDLVSGDDHKFTTRVAKVPVKMYRDFLKTL